MGSTGFRSSGGRGALAIVLSLSSGHYAAAPQASKAGIRLCSKIVRYFDQQDLPSIETLRPLSSALAALGSLQPGACGFL